MSATPETLISLALCARIDAVKASYKTINGLAALPFIYPNRAAGTIATEHIRCYILPNRARSKNLARTTALHEGILQIDVYVKADAGDPAAKRYADQLAVSFKAGQKYGGVQITDEPWLSPPDTSDAIWYRLPVNIPYSFINTK